MSDLEAELFYARVVRISYDGTSDPLDFLHAIESKTRTTDTEYQKMLTTELSIEGTILDWFIQVIYPHMTTFTWGQFKERIMRWIYP